MDSDLKRILYATPIRSLQDDPILTHRILKAPTENDLWEQDIVKASRRS